MTNDTNERAVDPEESPATRAKPDDLIRRLALLTGKEPAMVAVNLVSDARGPAWSTRFAAAVATSDRVFEEKPIWRTTSGGNAVEVRAVLKGTRGRVGRRLGVGEAEARGWLVPGTAPDERAAVLLRRALALLVEDWAPEALAFLPVADIAEGWNSTRPAEPRGASSWVLYDDRGEATPRRPTSPESCAARIETLLARAENPLRLLDLNASTLLDVSTRLDDGTERIARLWRQAVARPPEAG